MECTMRKIVETGNPLSNTIKDTSTIMCNPFALCREGLRMIVLVSLIVLLRGLPCFHDFSHGASHPCMIKALTYACTHAKIVHKWG